MSSCSRNVTLSSTSQQPAAPSITTSKPAETATQGTELTRTESGNFGPTVIPFPLMTTVDVPTSAPVPWPDVMTYTEQTYQINVNLGQEFAIGMFANGPFGFWPNNVNTTFIYLLADQMVQYPPEPNMYGTDWFLFAAIKTGETEINFNGGSYTKSFMINVA